MSVGPDVVWSFGFEEGDKPLVKKWTYLARSWAQDRSNAENNQENAQAVAADVIVDWLTPKVWADLVGDDDDLSGVVTIHSPRWLAGTYRVSVERVFKGSAVKVEAL
jgi:hypothetical protein